MSYIDRLADVPVWGDDACHVWDELIAVVREAEPHQHSYGGGGLEDALDALKAKVEGLDQAYLE